MIKQPSAAFWSSLIPCLTVFSSPPKTMNPAMPFYKPKIIVKFLLNIPAVKAGDYEFIEVHGVLYQEKRKSGGLMGLFDRLKEGLAKTRKGFIEKVESVFSQGKIDEEVVNELEEILITSDIGVHAAAEIVNSLKDKIKKAKSKTALQQRNF